MGKHDYKDKHKKKHKKERHKHKKEKKFKKYKREKSEKNSSPTCFANLVNNTAKSVIMSDEKNVELQDWNFLETSLGLTTSKNHNREKIKDESPYEPRHNVKELNPYWKGGGSGLPPNLPSRKPEGSVFLKPGEEITSSMAVRTYHQNWKKKANELPSTTQTKAESCSGSSADISKSNTSNTMTNAELNTLGAKLVKAEILGNKELAEKLKAQLEAAKQAKCSATSDVKPFKKYEEVVVVTSSNSLGMKKSFENRDGPDAKKTKFNYQNATDKFLAQNNKYELKNMFVKEMTEQEDDIMSTHLKVKNLDELDDVYLDAAASDKFQKKRERLQEKKSKQEALIKHKTLEGCKWCLDNRNETKHLIVSTGKNSYLCIPQEQSLSTGHCIIVPIYHEMSTRKLDENIWEEINTYQKLLTKMFADQGKDVIFFENARSFKYFPHSYIQCVPLSKEIGDMAPIYFQKAISESETEWCRNKKVIDFRNKDLRKSIPRDLPYFSVSFGIDGGFAHIIEDEQLFPKNFAEEIIGNMLELDPRRWRKPIREAYNIQREKTLEFLKMWKKFEFNSDSSNSESDSESSSSE